MATNARMHKLLLLFTFVTYCFSTTGCRANTSPMAWTFSNNDTTTNTPGNSTLAHVLTSFSEDVSTDDSMNLSFTSMSAGTQTHTPTTGSLDGMTTEEGGSQLTSALPDAENNTNITIYKCHFILVLIEGSCSHWSLESSTYQEVWRETLLETIADGIEMRCRCDFTVDRIADVSEHWCDAENDDEDERVLEVEGALTTSQEEEVVVLADAFMSMVNHTLSFHVGLGDTTPGRMYLVNKQLSDACITPRQHGRDDDDDDDALTLGLTLGITLTVLLVGVVIVAVWYKRRDQRLREIRRWRR